MGLVTEVVPASELKSKADELAVSIAASPPSAVQGTLRAIWAARDLGRLGGRSIAPSLLSTAIDSRALQEGAENFSAGERPEPRLR